MAVPVIKFPVLMRLIRLMGVLVASLVLTWTVHYRGGLALVSANKDLIFNVHPVLMVIGLVLVNGEAMLAYKTVPGTKSFKKLVHLTLQFLAFCLSLIGFWTALKFHNDKGIDNFYSLHSWLGLSLPFPLQHPVGFWVCNLLVSGRFKKPQGHLASMACLLWGLYLCSICCHCYYWDLRKSHFPPNQQGNITLLH
ncbi:hypothetical protein OIU76_028058 [Salix suchowensis]|nr:hypothetical protein OIU76_028058 [Salix suchowensis]